MLGVRGSRFEVPRVHGRANRLTGEEFPQRLMRVKMPVLLNLCKGAFLFVVGWTALLSIAHAEWQRTETTLAWRQGTNVLWQFNFDPQKGKPFFHPLATTNGTVLTNFKPEDHPWHYGLWFSWKY